MLFNCDNYYVFLQRNAQITWRETTVKIISFLDYKHSYQILYTWSDRCESGIAICAWRVTWNKLSVKNRFYNHTLLYLFARCQVVPISILKFARWSVFWITSWRARHCPRNFFYLAFVTLRLPINVHTKKSAHRSSRLAGYREHIHTRMSCFIL